MWHNPYFHPPWATQEPLRKIIAGKAAWMEGKEPKVTGELEYISWKTGMFIRASIRWNPASL